MHSEFAHGIGMVAAASDAIENAIMFSMVSDMQDPLAEMAVHDPEAFEAVVEKVKAAL